MTNLATNPTPTVFNFGAHVVRTAGTPDAPLFRASDVCAILAIVNVGDALARLRPNEKSSICNTDAREITAKATNLVPQAAIYVTEQGLYKLVFTSRKPDAAAFQDWIAGEVLPAIRKTGGYLSQPLSPTALIRAHLEAVERLERQQAAHDVAVATLTAKVDGLADERHDARTLLAQFPCPYSEEAVSDDRSWGQMCHEALTLWCRAGNGDYPITWSDFKGRVRSELRFDLTAKVKHEKKAGRLDYRIIDAIDDNDRAADMYAIAYRMFVEKA